MQHIFSESHPYQWPRPAFCGVGRWRRFNATNRGGCRNAGLFCCDGV